MAAHKISGQKILEGDAGAGDFDDDVAAVGVTAPSTTYFRIVGKESMLFQAELAGKQRLLV